MRFSGAGLEDEAAGVMLEIETLESAAADRGGALVRTPRDAGR